MTGINRPEQLSGWLLPEGDWYPTDEWWHITALYDLREKGHPVLQADEVGQTLKEGDEATIRAMAASLGFVKISRSFIDGLKMTDKQLRELQKQLQLCDLESEFGYLSEKDGQLRYVSVARILKLRSAHTFFKT